MHWHSSSHERGVRGSEGAQEAHLGRVQCYAISFALRKIGHPRRPVNHSHPASRNEEAFLVPLNSHGRLRRVPPLSSRNRATSECIRFTTANKAMHNHSIQHRAIKPPCLPFRDATPLSPAATFLARSYSLAIAWSSPPSAHYSAHSLAQP